MTNLQRKINMTRAFFKANDEKVQGLFINEARLLDILEAIQADLDHQTKENKKLWTAIRAIDKGSVAKDLQEGNNA